MCRSIKLVAAAAAVLGSVTAALGGLLVPRNGVVWDATFEGDFAPPNGSTPAWANFDSNGFPAQSTDGDIYSYVSGSVGSTVSFQHTSTWVGGGTARTIEYRVRVPDNQFQASDGVGAFLTGVNDGSVSRALDFRMFSDSIQMYNGGGTSLATHLIDNTVFHTYREVIDVGLATDRWKLYVDGNPTPVLSSGTFLGANYGAGNAFDTIVFGDFSTGGLSGKLDVDFLSWTAGAHPPIPEPTGIALLACGVAALLRRRA